MAASPLTPAQAGIFDQIDLIAKNINFPIDALNFSNAARNTFKSQSPVDIADALINLAKLADTALSYMKAIGKTPPYSTALGPTVSLANISLQSVKALSDMREKGYVSRSALFTTFSEIGALMQAFGVAVTGTILAAPAGITLAIAGAGISCMFNYVAATYSIIEGQEQDALGKLATDFLSGADAIAQRCQPPEVSWGISAAKYAEFTQEAGPVQQATLQFIHMLDPTLTLSQAKNLLFSSVQFSVMGQSQVLLNEISLAILGTPPRSLGFLPAFTEYLQSLGAALEGRTDLRFRLMPTDSSALLALAASDTDYLVNMVRGVPFVIKSQAPGYTDMFPTVDVSLYSSSTGKGALTTKWLQDRADYMSKLVQAEATAAKQDPLPFGGTVTYTDIASGQVRGVMPGSSDAIVFGSNGKDIIKVAVGPASTARIYGMGGNDIIENVNSKMYVEGGEGNDVISGSTFADELHGLAGNDTIKSGTGASLLVGGEGKDLLVGGSGNNTIWGDEQQTGDAGGLYTGGNYGGEDKIFGGDGQDTIYGGGGSDQISGGAGNDLLYGDGQDGSDGARIGNDFLAGNDGNDEIYAGGGNDFLIGGIGNDLLNGGTGVDIYSYAETAGLPGGIGVASDGNDSIVDSDGKGIIRLVDQQAKLLGGSEELDSTLIAGIFFKENGVANGWQSLDGKISLTKTPAVDAQGNLTGGYDLAVKFKDKDDQFRPGSITLKNWQDGNLNIRLVDNDSPPVPVINGSAISGDLEPEKVNDVFTGASDEYGNLVVSTVADIDRVDILFDRNKNLPEAAASNDRIISLGGRDSIFAAAGDDWIQSGNGADRVEGGDGNDRIETGDGQAVDGETGFDAALGDIAFGGTGNDSIFGTDSEQSVKDGIAAGDTRNNNAPVSSSARGDWLNGGEGDDLVIGTNARDVISGGTGRDTLISGAGDDWVLGDVEYVVQSAQWSVTTQAIDWNFAAMEVEDTNMQLALQLAVRRQIFGPAPLGNPGVTGQGDDVIYAGAGNDWVTAGRGDDFVDAGSENDTVIGGGGADVILGGAGSDWVVGDFDPESGPEGADIIDGGADDDFLFGMGGDDTLFGGKGNDWIEGGSGNDYLEGGAGNDNIWGGSGNDTILAGAGNDVLRGGAGKDTYIFTRGDGVKTVIDPDGADGSFGDPGDATNPNRSVLILNGISSSQVTFRKGSLLIDMGPLDPNDPDSPRDQIHFEGFNASDPNATQMLDSIVFDDGTVMTYADILAQGFEIEGTDGNDNGFYGNDGVYRPTLTGTGVNDRIRGKAGDDTLIGLAGDDTYFFNVGDGHDKIIDSQGVSQLVFGPGVTAAGLQVAVYSMTEIIDGQFRNVGYLRIGYGDQGDYVDVRDGLLKGDSTYKMGDGTVLSQEQLLSTLQTPLTLYGGEGAQTLVGGAGNDMLTGGQGNDLLIGGAGNDSLVVYGHDNEMRGGDGDDTISSYGGNNLMSGGAGNDSIVAYSGNNTLIGGAGVNLLQSGNGDDVYVHNIGSGTDIIRDSGGDNVVRFGTGIAPADIHGELVSGDDGKIYMKLDYGSDGMVMLEQSFNVNQPSTYSFEFADGTVKSLTELMQTAFTESIYFQGGSSGVGLTGTALNDTLMGSTASDMFDGGAGDDYLFGGDGADVLFGGAGNDTLYGGTGSDQIVGSEGDSVIDGGTGGDTITLGGGNNTVSIGRGMGRDTITRGSGEGVINEFVLHGDITLAELRTQQIGNDLYIHLRNSSDGVLLTGYFDPGQDYADSTWQVRDTNGTVTSVADVIANQPADVRPNDVQAAWQAFQERAWNYYRNALSITGFHADGNGNYVKDVYQNGGNSSYHLNYTVSLGSMGSEVAYAGAENHRQTEVITTVQDSTTTTTTQTTYGYNSGFRPASGGFAGKRDSVSGGGGGTTFTFVPFEQLITYSAFGMGHGWGTPVYQDVPISQENPTGHMFTGYLYSNPTPGGASEPASQPVTTTYFNTQATRHDTLNSVEIIGADGDKTILLDKNSWSGFNFVDSGGGNNLIQVMDNDIYAPDEQIYQSDAVEENAVGSFLYGSGNNDTLIGGKYDDALAVGNGDKLMIGGGGNNAYYLFKTAGHDKIINIGAVAPSMARDSVLYMPAGIALAALTHAWGTDIASNTVGDDGLLWGNRSMVGQSVYRTLTLSWNVDSSVTIVMPHADQNSGLGGIDYVQFSDGTRISFADLVQHFGGLPDIDPRDQANTITVGAGDIVFDGGDGNDVLTAGSGHDTLIGGNGQDTLIGGSQASVLIGGKARNVLNWQDGLGDIGASYYNDAGDVFIGGAGDDTIWGGSGADIYEFGLTGAHYTVANLHSTNMWNGWYGPEEHFPESLGINYPLNNGLPIGQDILKFGAGISASDVTISLGGDLVFTIGSNGQTVQFHGWRGWGVETLKEVQFADGTVWSRLDMQAGLGTVQFNLGMGAGVINNPKSLQYINVGSEFASGNASLSKVGLDLVLSVGEGGDSLTLKGWFADPAHRAPLSIGFSDDTWNTPRIDDLVGFDPQFEFTSGMGLQTISYLGNITGLTAAAGLAAADITVTRDGYDMVLSANNGADQLRLANWYMDAYNLPTLGLHFADESVLDSAALTGLGLTVHAGPGSENLSGLDGFRNTLIGDAQNNVLTAGNLGDTLAGGGGNDTFNGGFGDDLLQAGAGSSFMNGQQGTDIYEVDLSGSGNTVIYDTGNVGRSLSSAWQDILQLPEGISIEDLTYRVVHGSQYDGRDLLEIRHGQAAVSLVYGEASAWWQAPVGVQNIRFADGTLMTRTDFMQQAQRVDDAPVVTTSDQVLLPNQAVSSYGLFSVIDPENDPVSVYRFTQAVGGTGHFELNGVAQEAGVPIEIAYSYAWALTFVAGSEPGSSQISVEAYDGYSWSAASTFELSTQDLLRRASSSAGESLTAGTDTFALEGAYGNDTLSAGAGNSYLNGKAGDDLLVDGGGHNLLIGGAGNDTLQLGSGTNVVAFNAWDGNDTVLAGSGTGNTLSLGGGALYENLSFSKNGDDLVLGVDSSSSVTFKDWYASSANHNFVNLQIVADTMYYYSPNQTDPLVNKKVQSFDFEGLVAAFDDALAGTPALSSWNLSSALLQNHLGGSDTEALGGDLAYRYGEWNSVAGIGITPAQQTVQASGFGEQGQALHSQESLQQGLVRLG